MQKGLAVDLYSSGCFATVESMCSTRHGPRRITVAGVGLATWVLAACGSDGAVDSTAVEIPAADSVPAETVTTTATVAVSSDAADAAVDEKFPDIVDASATLTNGAWTFNVTVSSPYDSPERYADGWRILGPDGTEYGFRLLTHDHASEQPFTRALSNVQIPDDVDTVTIEGRDQVSGFGGGTFHVTLSAS